MKKAIKLIIIISIFALTSCTNKQNNTKKNNIYLLLETEGLGQISYYIDENRKMEFNDDFPKQQAYIKLDKKTKVTINAKADENSKFVKWTKDNKDYSTKAKTEINISSATKLTAVFTNK